MDRYNRNGANTRYVDRARRVLSFDSTLMLILMMQHFMSGVQACYQAHALTVHDETVHGYSATVKRHACNVVVVETNRVTKDETRTLFVR